MIIKIDSSEIVFDAAESKFIAEMLKSTIHFLTDVDAIFEEVPWDEFGVEPVSPETIKNTIDKLKKLKLL